MGAVHFLFPEHMTLIMAIDAIETQLATMKKGDTHYVDFVRALKNLKDCEMSCRFFGFTDDTSGNLSSEVVHE